MINDSKYSDKHLLIVGGGIFQTFAIKEAKKLGLTVSVLDQDQKAPGVMLSDHFVQASTRDYGDSIKKVSKHHQKYPINGVMTCGTDASLAVAHIATHLGLKSISPDTALKATDKGIMRQTLKDKGVPVPDFFISNDLNKLVSASKKMTFPLVTKPVDNMGARGVKQVKNELELIEAIPLSIKNSASKTAIIESYLEGYELSIETIVYDKKIHLITIADRIITSPPYFIEKGHTIPSIHPQDELDQAFEMAKMGIKALGIDFGPVKFDMKVTKHGPFIGEMTARLSGGFHSQLTEPLATGMNSIKAVIDLSLGFPLDINDITPKKHHVACERSLYPEPGLVINIEGLIEAKKMNGVAYIHLNVKEGDSLYPLTSNIGKAGHVITYASTHEQAIKIAEDAIQIIKIETQPETVKG